MFPSLMGGAFGKVFSGERGGAAAVSWWLSGGVTAGQCVAAYAAKGAASYAASKVNLNAPGTYDCTDGATFPTWDTGVGWIFATNIKWLVTGIVPASNQTWSWIVKFDGSSTSSRVVMGSRVATYRHELWNCDGFGSHYYQHGSILSKAGNVLAGIMAVAGNTAYLDGVAEVGAIPSNTGTNTHGLYIGCRNNAGSADNYFLGNITSAAIYNITLTQPQVAAIGAAMP